MSLVGGYFLYNSFLLKIIKIKICMSNYITSEGDKHIVAFKYKGKDLSITYEYLWSPLADKMLEFTPSNIAPNTITLIGFLFNIIGTLVLVIQLPFSSDAPKWSLFFYGISVFIYQMLDNLDGKQARKIKNSTPLGMIMDHGCDALGVIALSSGMARVICLNSQTLFVICYVFVVFSFYMSAWCQYHSNGIMILGKFNGVDEGIPVIWFCAILSGFLGQQVWRTPVSIFGHTIIVNELAVYAIILSGFFQIYSVTAQSGQEFTKDVGKALKDLKHAGLLAITIALIMLHTNLVHTHVVGFALGLAFTMARTISYTLVCSVAEMKFEQFQPSVIVFILVYSLWSLFLQNIVPPSLVVYGVMLFAMGEYFLFVFKVSNHIADILHIRIFKVFKPKQQITK